MKYSKEKRRKKFVKSWKLDSCNLDKGSNQLNKIKSDDPEEINDFNFQQTIHSTLTLFSYCFFCWFYFQHQFVENHNRFSFFPENWKKYKTETLRDLKDFYDFEMIYRISHDFGMFTQKLFILFFLREFNQPFFYIFFITSAASFCVVSKKYLLFIHIILCVYIWKWVHKKKLFSIFGCANVSLSSQLCVHETRIYICWIHIEIFFSIYQQSHLASFLFLPSSLDIRCHHHRI